MKARLRPAELRGVRKGKGAAVGALVKLFAEAELGDQVAIAGDVLPLEIVEQRTALVDHHEKTAARVIVLRVGLEMIGQRLDSAGEDRDLDFGRTRVTSARPWSLISSAFFSAVIDIVILLKLDVEPAHDKDVASQNLYQGDRPSGIGRKVKSRRRGVPGKPLSKSEQPRFVGSDGEGRDVVQPRDKRENRPIKLARLSGMVQKVQ